MPGFLLCAGWYAAPNFRVAGEAPDGRVVQSGAHDEFGPPAGHGLREHVLVLPNLLQLFAVGAALAGAAFARRGLRACSFDGRPPRWPLPGWLQPLLLPMFWLLLVGIAWQAAVLQELRRRGSWRSRPAC
jgi:hypothetical protein